MRVEADGAELYRSERTLVTRSAGSRWGVPVVRTRRSGPDARRRTVHEAQVLQSLQGVSGVPRLLSDPQDAELVVADVGGVALARLIAADDRGDGAPWRFTELVDLAVAVTRLLCEIHRRGVVHRDISPANIVLHGPDRTPMLVDFEIAAPAGHDPAAVSTGEIRGTLAYLAPEQTGRTGRPVDHRADLYALGGTLYDLAAGRPPFGRGEEGAVVLVHDHLARRPVPLSVVCPELPRPFCEIVARLLEKDPDRRYQSGEGLLHDLRLVRNQPDGVAGAPIRLGTRDFPLRLQAPDVLVGRAAQTGRLAAAWQDAVAGGGRALLVHGPAGVGKTALTDRLRPVVAASGGWVLPAVFDPDGRGNGGHAGLEVPTALARLLLAEPESRLRAVRHRLLDALGEGAVLLAGLVPELALVLDLPGTATSDGSAGPAVPLDPVRAQAAVVTATRAALAAVSAAGQPLFVLFDGLQWAPTPVLDLAGALLAAPVAPGLLVVATVRDETDELPRLRTRWAVLGPAPDTLPLTNLGPDAAGDLVAEVLRCDPADAGRLAALLHPSTGGNPEDTLELLGGLRDRQLLAPGPDGWTWAARDVQRYAAGSERADLLRARVDRLPAGAQDLLAVLACLRADADLTLLSAAVTTAPATFSEDLAQLLAAGLVTADDGDLACGGLLRLRHPGVRPAVLERLGEPARRALHLRIARLLSEADGHRAVAADQYRLGADDLDDPLECRHVVHVLAAAAEELRLARPEAAEQHLATALVLLERARAGTGADPAADADLTLTLRAAHHSALYALGRLEDADAVHRSLQESGTTGPALFAAGAVQVASLTDRARPHEAVALGLRLLAQLGLPAPARDELPGVVAAQLPELYVWVEDDVAGDVDRPEIADPVVAAACGIVSVLMPPAFFSDQDVMAWLVLLSRRLWAEHGPCRALVAPLCHAAVVTIGLRQDFAVGYRVVRRVLDAAAARRWEPETSRARFLFAVSAGHWFEPLEGVLDEARQARDGLLAGGDAQGAVFTTHSSIATHLDVAPAVDDCLAAVDDALALAGRTGNDQTAAALLPYRRLAAALVGGGPADRPDLPDRPDRPDLLDLPDLAALTAWDPGALAATNPMAAVNGHQVAALAAALTGDDDALVLHAGRARTLLPFLCGHYAMARVHLLHGLALARLVARHEDEDRTPRLLVELDACRAWMAGRAADNPAAFAHLSGLLDAERHWAAGDVLAARAAFDRALAQGDAVGRPWHRAFLLERAGRFAQAQQERHLAGVLLRLARDAYAAWGARAKVTRMEREHPALRDTVVPAAHRASTLGISTDDLDMLAVLQASQALGRETDLDALRERVVEVLSAMTGATAITVLLRDEDGQEWFPASRRDGQEDGPPRDLAQVVPLSVVRFAARTGEQVVVSDVAGDHRFAADPYLRTCGGGSLLVVPVMARGQVRVMLVLENRLHRGAFSGERLDALRLVAGQLSASFDTALARRRLQTEADRRLVLLGRLQARERLLETLLAIQRDIARRAPLQQVLDAVTAGASSLLEGDYVALVMADGHAGELPRVPSAGGAAGSPGADGQDGAGAMFDAPVHVNGELIGSLVSRTTGAGTASTERRDLLAAFAEQVSLALNDATTLQAVRAASMDSLTGLASRPLFLERLDDALRHDTAVSVLFIDLDRFKQVNDSLGHDAGDQLLAGVASRVLGCIREGDTAARLGGDEFAVLLREAGGPAGLRVGEALTAALLRPFQVAGKQILAAASIGVAVGGPGDGAPALLKQADLAMYRAKRERSRRPVLFEDQMRQDVSRRLDLEGDLERAVRSAGRGGGLWLAFQPQVRTPAQGRPEVVGLEALARWTHPERGPISPAEFVPLAEDTGVIVDLGRWVLRQACHEVARWRREGNPGLRVSVNVSGRQLMDGRLAGDVRAALADAGLDPDALTLELTESVLMDDPTQSLARMHELKAIGVRLSLDDFGTGYSSLSYLHRFPVDELKVDRSFVEKIDLSDADVAIVRMVLELARILGLGVVAEGVETPGQHGRLLAMGCRVAQGFLFSRPLPAAEVPGLLAGARLPRPARTAGAAVP